MIDRNRLWEFVKRLPASRAAELLTAVGLEVSDLVEPAFERVPPLAPRRAETDESEEKRDAD